MPKMTESEIQNRIAELVEEINDHQGEIDVLRARIKVLQAKCPHTDKYSRSHYDGSTSENCDRCG